MNEMTIGRTASSPQAMAEAWVEGFNAALAAGDVAAATALFAPTCFWRDLLAFTWNIKTVEGQAGIADLLTQTLAAASPVRLTLSEPATTGASPIGPVVEAWATLETAVGRGIAVLRLRDGLAWTLLTTMEEIKGHEEPRGRRRPLGAVHGSGQDRRSWAERREAEIASIGRETQPEVLIIGGGQGGIALAARLRQLDVPHLVIDRHARPGDQWRRRYKSLCLHDPVWYDHLPYLPFPDNWPVFAPKDKIGDWLEMYTRVMELNYWPKTAATKAAFDEAAGRWQVTVERDGESLTLSPRQLVLATGMSGKPNIPAYPGRERFRGEQHHSSQHPGPDAYAGRRVVIIGSNNSAHDIAAALWEAGADVTMVQRSSTHVVKSDTLGEMTTGLLYSEDALARGITTDRADRISASIPYGVMADYQRPIYAEIRKRDAAFYEKLAAAGFQLDFGADDSGLFMKYLRRGSGYYIDVGACDLVASGRIKLKNGDVSEITEDSVRLKDGTELPADLIVYATGYGSMNGWAADLISQEVADRVGKVWGLGSDTPKDPGPWEGELRNMWKPTQQPNLWFHGGNLHQSRHYSLYLALQLKARQLGMATPVYGLQETHHRQ